LVTFIRPIFFYHKLVSSSPALGFGGVVTPPGIQELFKEQALNADLTIDGVHLNAKGLDIYRKVLLNVLNSP
jgi:hypothetical protein